MARIAAIVTFALALGSAAVAQTAPVDPTLAGAVTPARAYRNGWMPRAETGVDAFLAAHPTFDGRGVLIAILDSGIDPGVPGLGTTSTGSRKILDLRDFSGEGAIALAPLTGRGDVVMVAGHRLSGYGRVAALGTGTPVYGGVLRERTLGDAPAADLNGNGQADDSLPVVVVRASDGWVLLADTDGDGSLANERPVHDFLAGHETFGWRTAGQPSPLTIAVNLADGAAGGAPVLDLFFDTSAHGSHVSGIASGHDIYGVRGFDGIAPGAQLLGCKIANDAEGGLTVTSSMLRALDYAIRFAAARNLPLVVNLSFGVGNEREGAARIDAVVDSVLALHPDVVFAVSAGNDGPGLSSLGFPGSAARVISVGATTPAAFLAGTSARVPSPIAFFSSRGGELAKPDVVAPGTAYSTVPRWDAGGEQESGTSMASPHVAGLAALLESSVTGGRRPDAATIRQALMVTARPLAGGTFIDQGAGLPDVAAAWRWLSGGHVANPATVTVGTGHTAAYQVVEEGTAVDTVAAFTIRLARADSFRLRRSAPWLHAAGGIALGNNPADVRVTYDARALVRPGVYTGVVAGWTADSLAGPAFRLVNTVVVAHRRGEDFQTRVDLPSGALQRIFFMTDSERPFEARVSSDIAGSSAYLHEPDGMPYREGNGAAAGAGDEAATFDVGGDDVVRGAYELVVAAPPLEVGAASVEIRHSPVTLRLQRDRDGVAATLVSFADSALAVRAAVVVTGAERSQAVFARGSEVQRIPLVIPAWARGLIVETTMDRAQWTRFTDFGVTLFDSAGGQIAKEPLNYALGRLQVPLPEGHGAMRAELALFPGFADSTVAAMSWSARIRFRLYADSAVTLEPVSGAGPVMVTVAPHATSITRLRFTPAPWTMGDGFFPLAAIVVQIGGRVWSREAGLPEPTPGVMR